jgi:hypothetical protein
MVGIRPEENLLVGQWREIVRVPSATVSREELDQTRFAGEPAPCISQCHCYSGPSLSGRISDFASTYSLRPSAGPFPVRIGPLQNLADGEFWGPVAIANTPMLFKDLGEPSATKQAATATP